MLKTLAARLGATRQKVALPEGTHGILRRAGLDIVRYPPVTLQDQCRNRLLVRHRIDHLFDVGANVGQYASAVRRAGFAGWISSVEPQSAAFGQLTAAMASDDRWRGVNDAVGTEEGEVLLNIAGNSMSSSIFAMTERHRLAEPTSEYQSSEKVRVRALDEVVSGLSQPGERLALKLDTQGGELAMIESLSSSVLKQVHIVEAEVALERCYEGDSMFSESVTVLQQLGYSLVGIWPAFADHRHTGHVLQVDVFCVRDR